MIPYSPVDGEAWTQSIRYRPRTCFLMSKLGNSVPEDVQKIRAALTANLAEFEFSIIDAESEVTGRDLLLKIWKQVLTVPLGVAIVHEDMKPETLGNVFYELGLLQAYGKETLIVKTEGARIPSDFVRTEYVPFGPEFDRRIRAFMRTVLDIGEHYGDMAENFAENNPLLAIDYLRRAYLILGDAGIRDRKKEVFVGMELQGRARNSVEELLASF